MIGGYWTGVDSCATCFSMDILTLTPITVAQDLDCSLGGDLCSDCPGFNCLTFTGPCPGSAFVVRTIDLKTHTEIRPDGAPAWVTMEVGTSYAGTVPPPNCGNKTWGCHTETLEISH